MSDLQRLEAKIDRMNEALQRLQIEFESIKAHQCPSPGSCDQLISNQSSLFDRLREVELWQATRTGQLTLLGAFFGVVGVAVTYGIVKLIKHF